MFETCPGCGGSFTPEDGPIHRYMMSSPACWAAFGRVLAAEYSDPELMITHRLSVDSYAVQHPGDGSRQAIQSVALHLARLMVQLDAPLTPQLANEVMLRLSRWKGELPELVPPTRFAMTVANVSPFAGTPRHGDYVREWANASWQAWSAHHALVRSWVDRLK